MEQVPGHADAPVGAHSSPMGDGWWQASDGWYYSPERHPQWQPAPQPPEPPPRFEAPLPAFAPIEPLGDVPTSSPASTWGAPAPAPWGSPRAAGPAPAVLPPPYGNPAPPYGQQPQWNAPPPFAGAPPAASPSRPRPWWVSVVVGLAVLALLGPVVFVVARTGAIAASGANDPGEASWPDETVFPGDELDFYDPRFAEVLDPADSLLVFDETFGDARADWFVGADSNGGSSTYGGDGYTLASPLVVGSRAVPFRSLDRAIAVSATAHAAGGGPMRRGIDVGCDLQVVGQLDVGRVIHLSYRVGRGYELVSTESLNQAEGDVFGRHPAETAPKELSILCRFTPDDSEVEIVGFGDGVEVLRRVIDADIAPSRWHAAIGGITEGDEQIVFSRVQVRDPLVREVDRKPIVTKTARVLNAADLTSTDHQWLPDPYGSGGLVSRQTDAGFRITAATMDAWINGPEQYRSPALLVGSTVSIPGGSPGRGGSGVGCIDETHLWAVQYTFTVSSTGAWGLRRGDMQAGSYFSYTLRLGGLDSTELGQPYRVELACVVEPPGVDGGAVVVRLVGSVGGQVVVDVADSVHQTMTFAAWKATLNIDSRIEGPFDAVASSVTVSTLEE